MSLSVSSGTVPIARTVFSRDSVPAATPGESQSAVGTANSSTSSGSVTSEKTPKQELTTAEQRQVAELVQIDRAVRAHEQAHIAAGRDVITSNASFTYTYGPDGKQYVIGGEVGIDTSAESKPEANISKGQRIQAAAMAPADPSPQDYQVAAIGVQLVAQGNAALSQQARDENSSSVERTQQRVSRTYSIAPEPNSAFEAFA